MAGRQNLAHAEVVRDEPLDRSLGAIGIGPLVIVAPPGLREWRAAIDLRPQCERILSLHARLDPTTGVATWTVTPMDAGA
jgi:hypothetical protein